MHRFIRDTFAPRTVLVALRLIGRLLAGLRTRLHAPVVATGADRGDVPGWVLVTIMTAGLVTALWVVADDQLTRLLETALSGVTGP
jgi:hypothetical protein